MKNAGPIDPPTDPFASVPMPARPKRKKPRIAGLPPGVSPDIYGQDDHQAAAPQPSAPAIPPVAPPPQPWPMTEEQRHDPPPPPAPVFGIVQQPETRPELEPEPSRRRSPLALVLIVAALAAVYVVPAIFMSGSVLRGTKVGGVDIGGLTVSEAGEKVRTGLADTIARPLVVLVDGRKETIQPADVGLELDVVATIGQAPSGFPSPAEVWRGLTGTTELEPKLTVDAVRLAAAVEGLADAVDKEPREGGVSFEGLQPVAVTPRDGQQLDQGAATQAISAAFLHSTGTVALSLSEVKATTALASVNQVAAQAKDALSGPIVLTRPGRTAELTLATIAANLTFEPDRKGGLRPKFNAKRALAGVESRLVDAAQAPRDATLDLIGGQVVVTPARKGRGVDDKKLAQDVAGLVTTGGSRTIPVELAVVRPNVTEQDFTELGVKEQVSEVTTGFDCCLPRVTNIRVMAARLDGYLVKPGETLSLNTVVGRPAKEDGYVEAPQIGGRIVQRYGGGTGQFATTMYNAAYFGGYEDVDHTPQDFHMLRYPDGRDAALLYPSIDLKWRNDSRYGVLVKTSSTPTSVTVALWSTRRYDEIKVISSGRKNIVAFGKETSSAPGCFATSGQVGFTIDVTRSFVKDGKEVKRDEKLTSTYRPQVQRTCVVKDGLK